MRANRAVLPGIFAIILISGCDRPAPAPASRPAPTTAATELLPATMPAGPVIISVEGNRFEFPPAILTVRAMGDESIAILFSDDPPQAADENYTGNGFYIEMPLELTGDTFTGAEWNFKASNSERIETVAGIYLRSRRQVLQPYEAHARFGGSKSPVPITLEGTFLLFGEDELLGERVQVKAELSATLQSAREPTSSLADQ